MGNNSEWLHVALSGAGLPIRAPLIRVTHSRESALRQANCQQHEAEREEVEARRRTRRRKKERMNDEVMDYTNETEMAEK